MKLNFFKRLAKKIRQPFKKEKPEIVPEVEPETVQETVTESIRDAAATTKPTVDAMPEADAETVIVDEAETKCADEAGPADEAEPENISGASSDHCMKQARYFLFKEGKPIGKPFGRRSEIRIVYVNNFVECFLFFLRLCDQRLLTYRQTEGHLNCTAAFPDGNGSLTFTDRTTCHNKAVIAVLKVEISGLQPRLSEIRFEIKH